MVKTVGKFQKKKQKSAGYLWKRVVDTTERFLHFLQVDSRVALKNSPGVLLIMMLSA
jgi:hypothetical protein